MQTFTGNGVHFADRQYFLETTAIRVMIWYYEKKNLNLMRTGTSWLENIKTIYLDDASIHEPVAGF
jgi:hypothetical protein